MPTESKDMNVVGEEGVTDSKSGKLFSFALKLKTEEIAHSFKTAFTGGKLGLTMNPVFVQKDEPKSINFPESWKSPEKKEESTRRTFSFAGALVLRISGKVHFGPF